MPEVSKSIISDDPSFVQMLDDIADMKLTMFPELPLPDALRKLRASKTVCIKECTC